MTNDSGFDEESYLSRYGDVRKAVRAGVFSSGYAHYVTCGRVEGRDGLFKNRHEGQNERIELGGAFYQNFLKRMHSALQPNTYFEIGTLNGDTLKLASCTCISVDPTYQISTDVLGNKPACYFFQVGSDDFFDEHNPKEILKGTIDVAFLDGMHLFEYLLRDFYNTEMYCSRDSIIILHDCIPLDEYVTVRDPSDPARQKSSRPGYWTGDVWKMIPTLREWRPDLSISVVDAPPTGLVLITNLDPGSRVLRDNYQSIVDKYLACELGAYGVERLRREANPVTTEKFVSADDFARFTGRAWRTDVQPDRSGEETGFAYLSPLDLMTGRSRDPTVEVTLDGPGDTRERSRPGASFDDDPDGTRLFSALDPVIVPHAPAFTLTAARLRQVGYRSYLSQGGFLFNDEALVNKTERKRFLARFGQEAAFLNEDTGLSPAGQSGLFRLDPRNRHVEQLAGEVISICSFEPTNYGSFLLRVLPKIAGRQGLFRDRTVIGPAYNQSMRDLYAMAGIPVERIIKHDTNVIYNYDKVIIPSNRNPHFLLDPDTLALYADLRDRFGTRLGARKILVSRLGWTGSYAATHRVMLNEEELARRLGAEGFDIVRTHTMTVRQQIEAFSSADVIVGAAGSAMFNVVFSHPGTKLVDIESEPHWIFAHQNLFGSCGLDYGIFQAKALNQDWSVHHKAFYVNVDALMTRVASL